MENLALKQRELMIRIKVMQRGRDEERWLAVLTSEVFRWGRVSEGSAHLFVSSFWVHEGQGSINVFNQDPDLKYLMATEGRSRWGEGVQRF